MSLIKAKGVDICVHNGDVDFEILKAYGVQFVMSRSIHKIKNGVEAKTEE